MQWKTEKYALKEKKDTRFYGVEILYWFPPVFLWLRNSYRDWNPVPTQPWKGEGGAVPDRDIRSNLIRLGRVISSEIYSNLSGNFRKFVK